MLGLSAPALHIPLELNPQRHWAWSIAGVFRCLPACDFPKRGWRRYVHCRWSIVEMVGQVGECIFKLHAHYFSEGEGF